MHPIIDKIAALRRRLLWRERAVAVCSTLAVVVAAAVVLGLADFWLQFRDRGLRVMVTAALAVVAGWAIYRWWYLPRRGPEQPLSVARRLESHFPKLQDQLASSLEFLTQPEDDVTAGSSTLRRAVVNQAAIELSELPLDAIVDRRPLKRAGIAAGIAFALVAGCLILNADAVRTALVRLVAPWGETTWPRVNHLAFRDPPTRLTVGQTFEAELVDRDGALPDDVRIEYRSGRAGRWEVQSEWMNRVGELMVGRRENVREPFAFRAVGGDDDSMAWSHVEVVEPPRLVEHTITVHPPAYTGLPATVLPPPLEVLAGSAIEVRGVANEPLGGARVFVNATMIDAATNKSRFAVAKGLWIASESGACKLELANRDGVWGTADEWRLRVESDPPPTVTWQQPTGDVFVLPTANVPIAAMAKDNLAIASVNLKFSRRDQSDDQHATVEMYRGPERATADPNSLGETRALEYTWPLATLGLPVGTQLTMEIVAEDYQPASGKTVAPRRVTIINREEFAARLADQQAQIAQRLDEAASLQRTARGHVGDLEIQLRDSGTLGPRDRDMLQASEFNQRRVHQMLADPTHGVAQLAVALTAEIEMNGVADAELRQHMEDLARELADLDAGALGAADRELTGARKSAENGDDTLTASLASAGSEQDHSIEVLERLLSELSAWADYELLVRNLAQLREDQLAHRTGTREAVDLDTLPLELSELSRQQRATLNRAAAGQAALADRFERLERGLAALSSSQAEKDSDAIGRLADAVEVARELAIASQMREAQRDLEANRVGQALARELAAADALGQLLDLLRNRTESNPEQLVEKLRAAERELAALRTALSNHRQELAQTESRPQAAANSQQRHELLTKQCQLKSQIDRLARELGRLQAAAAGESAEQAGEKLANAPTGEQQPVASDAVEQAEHELAKAAEQLAERRQQAEEDWAKAFLERFKAELATMMSQQREVMDDTAALEGERAEDGSLTETQQRAVARLAERERQLAADAQVHRELLSGLRVIGIALAAAEQYLADAAGELDRRSTGLSTQRSEQKAMARLEQIGAAVAEAAAAANNPPLGGQGSAGAKGPSKRPLFDLFEVKLLRSLQADLNKRTEALQLQPQPADRTTWGREAEQLAAEQGQLAELVDELLSRNNEAEDRDE